MGAGVGVASYPGTALPINASGGSVGLEPAGRSGEPNLMDRRGNTSWLAGVDPHTRAAANKNAQVARMHRRRRRRRDSAFMPELSTLLRWCQTATKL